ncbi:hypothetical protein BKI52_14150 [marine bacterium AO1-C]|nr:hypothetical protein BKI52_14150 [marine bacterium AO1-C]
MNHSQYLHNDPEAIEKIKKLIESNETANILLALEFISQGGFPAPLITHVYALIIFQYEFEVYYKASTLLEANLPKARLNALKQKEEILSAMDNEKEVVASAFLTATEQVPELDTPTLTHLMMIMREEGFAYCLKNQLMPNKAILDAMYDYEMLCFDHFGLTSLPPEVGLFPQATELSFKNNSFSDLPNTIAQMTRLKFINFENTPLSTHSIQQLEQWVPKAMADHYNDLAYDANDQKQYAQAFEYSQKAYQLTPDNTEYLHDMATYLAKAGKTREGLQYYDQAMEIAPHDLSSYIHKSDALTDLQEYQQSLEVALAGLQMVDNHSSTEKIAHLHFQKAYALNLLKEYPAAHEAYDLVLQLTPQDEAAWFNKACLYTKTHDKTAMLQCLEKAIQLLEKNKALAIEEKDFEAYWEDEDFLALVHRNE